MHGLPDHFRQAIREMGASAQPEINQKTKALFASVIDSAGGVKEEFDLAYGDHPRQTLDVYRLDDAMTGKTIVIYIPGGGFIGGDKRNDEVYFGNVGRFFARHGMVGVCANYRLAPEFGWPSGARDVQAAVRWIKENAPRFGGVANKIVVFGHSAGAAHVASYLFDPDLLGGGDALGAILASGPFAVRKGEVRANLAQYYGTDEALYARQEPLAHVKNSKVPVFVAISEYDPPALATPGFELARLLTLRDGKSPPFLRLDGHNHFSSMCSFGTEDKSFSEPTLAFIAAVGG